MSGTQRSIPVDESTASDDRADLMIDIAAGVAAPEDVQRERRSDKRHCYTALVGVAPVDETGTMHDASVAQGRNISVGGICVGGRTVYAPGTQLVLQLVRSDGSTAIVGGRVQHCRYIGEMQHETGIEFTPLSRRFDHNKLIAADGQLRLLHPKLGAQVDAHAADADAPTTEPVPESSTDPPDDQ